MEQLRRTVLWDRHVNLGALHVDFGGWYMPLNYPTGIVQEHLETRRGAGLFDVSHMGRFAVRGERAVEFLQHVLTNNAAALDMEESHYTIIPTPGGAAVDDAYLFRFVEDEYLLVVNAANRDKDREHLASFLGGFPGVELADVGGELVMLSLQGPRSRKILSDALTGGHLPEPRKNSLGRATLHGAEVLLSRTGYTGEPLGFELFVKRDDAEMLWDLLVHEGGARPAGLGARDTLRLEAGLPLYGHEMGTDPEGRDIPVFASPRARCAVSFSPAKGDFVGKRALLGQYRAFGRILDGDYSRPEDLPRLVMPVAVTGRGIARHGDRVWSGGRHAGFVTSGTMVPYWKNEGVGIASRPGEQKAMRAVCLALIDSDRREGDRLEIEIRGRHAAAVVVAYHLRSEAPPWARALPHDRIRAEDRVCPEAPAGGGLERVYTLVDKTLSNSVWRRRRCVNLIPSEQTPSPMARLLSIMDPAGRYAGHKQVKAFAGEEVFYYQGAEFMAEVEELLECELSRYLGCARVETRPISGQTANMAVYSGMAEYLNRVDRKREQRRLRKVLNHRIITGGDLSAQPTGGLGDYVMRDPARERPAVVNFPVLEDNPYKIDVEACRQVLEEHRPELIVFGTSVMLHTEPVAEIRAMAEELSLDCVIMYDMAHVLGLAGVHFQDPFAGGADLVTGSTHTTFFGTQRGIVASDYRREDPRFELWEAVLRRVFPGTVSNHHPGTMLGLLMAAYEMNAFRDEYQRQVIANAKAFGAALAGCGLDVAGDPAVSYTQTHQVVVNVGYAAGPGAARSLEEHNIIVNCQAAPDEEGFTAAGALRMGVSEMTRFGMKEAHFEELAELIRDALNGVRSVKTQVVAFRKRFLDMGYCFSDARCETLIRHLQKMI